MCPDVVLLPNHSGKMWKANGRMDAPCHAMLAHRLTGTTPEVWCRRLQMVEDLEFQRMEEIAGFNHGAFLMVPLETEKTQ